MSCEPVIFTPGHPPRGSGCRPASTVPPLHRTQEPPEGPSAEQILGQKETKGSERLCWIQVTQTSLFHDTRRMVRTS